MAEQPVAYQGDQGAHGEQALYALYGTQTQTLACATFREVLEAVRDGRAAAGVLPLENSTAGLVDEVQTLLVEMGIPLVAECVQRIHHCLLANVGTSLEHVRTVHSHPQALAQCASFLRSRGLSGVAAANTAIAARALAEKPELDQAVIASRLAAQHYGLKILFEGIEDVSENFTRFVAVGAAPRETEASPRIWKMALVAKPDSVAQLHALLGCFISRGLTVSRVVAQPAQPAWRYRYFLDVQARGVEAHLQAALREGKALCPGLAELGSYPLFG